MESTSKDAGPSGYRSHQGSHSRNDSLNSRKRSYIETTDGGGATADGSSASSSPERQTTDKAPRKSKATIIPLRRGDACLMCRAKKLKCSATKPVCDQCAKREDRCVYDAVRPASRVEKLERKLAEMEEAEMRSSLEPKPTPLIGASGISQSNLKGATAGSGGITTSALVPELNLAHLVDLGVMPFASHTSQPFSSNQNGSNVQLPGIMSANPSSMTASNAAQVGLWSFTDPFAGATSTAIPNSAIQQDNLPWPLLSTSNDVSTFWGSGLMADTNGNDVTNMDPFMAGLQFENVNTDPSQLVFPPTVLPNITPHPRGSQTSPASYPDMTRNAPGPNIDAALQHSTTYTGVQMSESDISQSAQDYLLDLFFCPRRIRVGSEPWTAEQFKNRLLLPPLLRPHPALLFAMYTVSASTSYIPAVRALADSLYVIAVKKLQESIAQEDRLLDTINASKLLAKWLFSKARPLEAYSMVWQSVSLCQACQLDKITTGKFSPQMGAVSRSESNPWPLLGPPKDQWELGERIHAFWAVWGNARASSFMIPWPTVMFDQSITTPLPYAPDAYLDGSIAHLPDITLQDIYELPYGSSKRLTYSWAFLLVAVHLQHRARELIKAPAESHVGYRKYASTQSGTGPQALTRNTKPVAYRELMDVAGYLQSILPKDLLIDKVNFPAWQGPDVPILHLLLNGVKLFLHDMEGDDFDRDSCIDAARAGAGFIMIWLRMLKEGEMKNEPFARAETTTSRTKGGMAGPYLLVPWFWVANKLVKGAKALRRLGRWEEAKLLSEDARLVIAGLKEQGVIYPVSPDWMEENASAPRDVK